MDTGHILVNGSPGEQPRSNESSTIRKLSNRKTVSTHIRNPEEPNTILELRYTYFFLNNIHLIYIYH
jgi:hypothetical protein